MPGESLTRIEAVERARVVTVESYDVALGLTTGPETFSAVTTVRFASQEGASTFRFTVTDPAHWEVVSSQPTSALAAGEGWAIANSKVAAHA